jgi:hypothetical protein
MIWTVRLCITRLLALSGSSPHCIRLIGSIVLCAASLLCFQPLAQSVCTHTHCSCHCFFTYPFISPSFCLFICTTLQSEFHLYFTTISAFFMFVYSYLSFRHLHCQSELFFSICSHSVSRYFRECQTNRTNVLRDVKSKATPLQARTGP